MSRLVMVTEVEPQAGSVWVVTGLEDDEVPLSFGIDHRMAVELLHRINDEGEVICSVEEWQVLA